MAFRTNLRRREEKNNHVRRLSQREICEGTTYDELCINAILQKLDIPKHLAIPQLGVQCMGRVPGNYVLATQYLFGETAF